MGVLRRVWLWLFILIGLIMMGYYFLSETQQLQTQLSYPNSYLLIVLVFQVLFWLMASVFWRQVLCLFYACDISILQSFLQLVFVIVGKYIPGKVWGMVARGAYLGRYGARSQEIVLATTYEQIFLIHSGVVISSLLLLFLYKAPVTVIFAGISVVSIFFGHRLQSLVVRIFLFVASMLGKSGEENELGATSISIGHYSMFVARFALLWVLSGMVFVSLYVSFFSTQLSLEMFVALLFSITAGVTIGFLALFAPGGIGVREAVSSGILSYYMPVADAVLLSVLFRVWSILFDALAGAVLLWFERRRP